MLENLLISFATANVSQMPRLIARQLNSLEIMHASRHIADLIARAAAVAAVIDGLKFGIKISRPLIPPIARLTEGDIITPDDVASEHINGRVEISLPSASERSRSSASAGDFRPNANALNAPRSRPSIT